MRLFSLHYLYRKTANMVSIGIICSLSLLALLPFFYIVYYVVKRGGSALGLALLTELPSGPGSVGGGLANGIIGSLIMVGLACALGVPWGTCLGVCLSEYRHSRISKVLRFIVDLSISTPSIVIGIFVYSLFVVLWGFSAYAGATALMIILIPIIARGAEETLRLIPHHIREAGLALGIPRWKIILRILIPGTITMLLSSFILAIARISGETAPLLFTALGNQFFSRSLSEPTASLPVQIYEFAKSGFPDLESMAWGGSLLLIALVFIINFITRFVIFMTENRRRFYSKGEPQ